MMAKRRGYDFSKGVRGLHRNRNLKFEQAPTVQIDQVEDLARELFSEILEMSYDDCLVTDESDLGFFVTDETPDDYEQRFRERYGFDLSEVTGGRIIDILRRIANRRRSGGTVN